jgi:hypothetical protein
VPAMSLKIKKKETDFKNTLSNTCHGMEEGSSKCR